MNDLAERALHGLDVARRQIAAHPIPSLAAAGFASSALAVTAGGRVLLGGTAIPLTSWFGLQTQHPLDAAWIPAAVSFSGICALVAVWLAALSVLRRRESDDRTAWMLAGTWALPFVVGPPLLSTDVYGYVARGLLQRHGLSPYAHSPLDLGTIPVVEAIDVNWRSTGSTAGPLASLLQHVVLSLAGGNALTAVVIYRLIAVLSAVAIGAFAAELAGKRRGAALALTVLNPAVRCFWWSRPRTSKVWWRYYSSAR